MKKIVLLILIFSTQLVFSQTNSKNPDYLIKIPSQSAVINEEYEAYRFVWLRTFQNPISILLEKSHNEINLFWIVGNGASGYQPEGIKSKGQKEITAETFEYFKNLLKLAEFQNLPDTSYKIMVDGKSWFLEQKTKHNHKTHITNNPSENFQIVCMYLAELAGMEYDKAHKDYNYNNIRIYLNDRNEVIHKESVIEKVISHLNNYISENELKSKWCYYPDYIVTIRANGRVASIRDVPEAEGLLERISYWFETYQCRNEFRRILRLTDFSKFNFRNKIEVHISLNHNKEKNEFYDDK